MRITESNEFTNSGTLTVPASGDEDTAQTLANVESFDFSEKYTSVGTDAIVKIRKTFAGDQRFTCGYVAVAGHNMGEDGGSLVLKVNSVTKGTISFADGRNSVVLVTFAELSLVTQIDLEYTKITSSNQITITFLAAGTVLTVPNNGEEAGYQRPWLTRNIKERVVQNIEAAPVVVLTNTLSRRMSLNVSNMGRAFLESTWRDFQDFAALGAFIVKEQDGDDPPGITDEPKSSYLCFGPRFVTPKAHPLSRELGKASINFQAYTGT